jgi:hypothetical protein
LFCLVQSAPAWPDLVWFGILQFRLVLIRTDRASMAFQRILVKVRIRVRVRVRVIILELEFKT